jgi:hypothetical protein
MYPAQALADGEYSVSDLPDAVTVDGTSFSRSETSYGNTTNGVILEGNVWAKYSNGGRSTRACLIQGGVEDQFADTYTVTWDAFGEGSPNTNVVVTRESLCVWRGSDPCGNVIFLYYGDSAEIGFGVDYTWNLRLNNYVEECGNPDFLNYFISKDLDAPSFQNSPVGYYPKNAVTDATVS